MSYREEFNEEIKKIVTPFKKKKDELSNIEGPPKGLKREILLVEVPYEETKEWLKQQHKKEEEPEEICAICDLNIKEINCFPIYSKKYNDIICSTCNFLGALYHKGMLSKIDLEPIPKNIRKKIMNIYQEG